MASSKMIFFTDSSMNIGGQELQALQQMSALQAAGFKTLLLCKPNSAILQRANSLGLAATPTRFRNAFHIPSFRQLMQLVRNKDPIAIVFTWPWTDTELQAARERVRRKGLVHIEAARELLRGLIEELRLDATGASVQALFSILDQLPRRTR